MTNPLIAIDRFFAKVDKSDYCWNWTGTISIKKYGSFSFNGKMMLAHRFAWILENGDIPSNLVIDHICRNRSCVRVEHLRLVSNRENILCGVGASAKNFAKTHCKHGHAFEGDNLVMEGTRRRCRACRKASGMKWLHSNYEKNKQNNLISALAYYERNKEEINKRARSRRSGRN